MFGISCFLPFYYFFFFHLLPFGVYMANFQRHTIFKNIEVYSFKQQNVAHSLKSLASKSDGNNHFDFAMISELWQQRSQFFLKPF